MSAEPGIRDAVRQLGRAVGTLVRAVVGAVGRRRPAAPERAESGPPQEWLDLVAETDPEWLARSAWADQGRRPRRSVRPTGVTRREEPTLIEPEWESVGDESSSQPEASVIQWPARRSVPTTSDVAPDELPVDAPPRRASDRPVRRLQPVTPRDEVEASDDPPVPVRRRNGPTQATPSDRPRDEVRSAAPEAAARPLRVAAPVLAAEPSSRDTAQPEVAVPPTRRTSEWLRPVPDLAKVEPARPASKRPRLASVHLLSPDHADDATARPTSFEGEAPDRPQPAALSAWPELPCTDTLDDPHPAPGLAARLWLADDRPDTLITAQRRS